MTTPKTIIAMPIKSLHPHTKVCLDRDCGRGYNFVSTEGCAYVDMARGLLANRINTALSEYPEHDVIVFIDEDMRWEERDLDVLSFLTRAIFEDTGLAPLLHATYAQRGPTGKTCHQRLIATDPCEQPRDLVIQGKVFPAVIGGLGFCAIHREGFLKFAEHCQRYRVTSVNAMAIDMFPTGVIDGQWYGEDILHCIRQFQFGDGSFWARPMVVEHMSSSYGAPLGSRLPSAESLCQLAGDTQPHQPDHNHEQDCQHAPQ